MSVKEVLDTFGKRVQQQSKANLTKDDKKDTGRLYNSVTYELETHKGSFTMYFNLTDYALYVDQGVKGSMSVAKAMNSPFRFGSGRGPKGGLTAAIDGWVRRKRIQFRERGSARFLSYKQTAFIITRSVYTKGLKPNNFFSKPFDNEFKKLPDELVNAFGLEVTDFMKYILKR